jgi:hypothetical protein
MISCGGSAVPSSTIPTAELPTCCTRADVAALDGRRVALVGRYEPTAVRMRPGRTFDEQAKTVAIVGDDGANVMLEIYYRPAGTRSDDELARFAGKRVRVVGTLHARTPDQYAGGTMMATMIGPYLGDIESITASP